MWEQVLDVVVVLGLAALGGGGVRYARARRGQYGSLAERLDSLGSRVEDLGNGHPPPPPVEESDSLVAVLLSAIVEQNKAILEMARKEEEA